METVQFIHDKFVDYAGKEHPFTVCARLEDNPELAVHDFEEGMGVDCVARLSLGVAICNPNDKWNEKKGEQIAEGRARVYCDDMAVITSKAMKSLFNPDAISDILANEAEFVKNHPGFFITGYDKAAAKYEAKLQRQADWDCLSDDERKLVNMIRNKQFTAAGLNFVKEALSAN